MAWSRQQNPTGISNPAVRPAQADPADITTTQQDLRKRTQRRSGRRRVTAQPNDLPIAANSRKVDGFASGAQSAGQ